MKRFVSILLVFVLICVMVLGCGGCASANAKRYEYDLANELRWFGRTYERNGKYYFNWSASGFEFSFKGSGVSATLETKAVEEKHTPYIKIYIDGVEQPDVALTKASQTIVLAKELDPKAEHTVKVVKRTNARSSPAALVSLKLTDGKKIDPPKNSSRLIEFVGDSITVGYATVARGANEWSTSTEDGTKTYAERIAQKFGADYNVVAISGRGVIFNSDGTTDKLMHELYFKLDEHNNPGVDYDFARQPDVIVINLGTNDSGHVGANRQEFRDGLTKFLKDVRAKNPKAEIIYAYGMMGANLSDDMRTVISQLNTEGDKHIRFVPLAACGAHEMALWHPTQSAYITRADVIISEIEKVMGW